jgi:PAS domain S-box-containing protein
MAEDALARSEELHRKMIITIPDIVVTADIEGIITFMNEQGVRLAGVPDAGAIVGKSIFSFFAPECVPVAIENTRLMFERPLGPVEYVFLSGDGRRISLEVNGDVLRTPDGTPYGMVYICRDITERRQAQEAIRQSEELYRSLANASPDGIALISLEGRLTFVSPRALAMFGLTDPAEALGTFILDWIDEPERSKASERFREIGEKKALVNHICRMVKKDGSSFDLEMHSAILHDKKGVVSGIISILRDITTRRKAEAALRESEEKYRRLISSTFNAVVIYQDNTVVLANDEAARISGYPSGADLVGKSIISFIHPDFRQIVFERQNVMLNTPDAVVPLIPEKFLRSDGSPVDVEVMASPIVYEARPAIQVIFRDITEQKRAEDALRESKEEYRRIIENMQDVFYQTDKDGILTMISTYGAQLVGYHSAGELMGKFRATDFYAIPAEREAFIAALKEKGAVTGYPLTLRDRQGNLHAATASSRLIFDKNGDLAGVEGILHDVTHIREVENALRQANRQITLMTSITRHDIRNQLLALNGWLELSRASIGNPDRMLELIDREQKIASIIGQQIDFTTLFDDMGFKPPVWQDLRKLVARAAAALPFQEMRLETNLPNVGIFADPLLEKVFYNLLDNALRYGGSGMTKICVSVLPDDPDLLVVIEDDGAGIPCTGRKRLFERGYGDNTGLGLFLAKEILAITGLGIQETGTGGSGARFEIRVPAGKFRLEPPDS